jgi:phage-related baseplate assembly protein
MNSVIDLKNLPAPTVVETLDFDAIFSAMLADLKARDPNFTATVESDPVYKLLEAGAYRELIIRQRVNDVARRRFIAFASGADLEHLAAFYGLSRLMVDAGNPDATPPVPPTYETDDAFRVRVRERIMGSSAAGSANWYRYHALTAHGGVKNVGVDAPSGGNVRVSVLGIDGDGTPSDETIEAVRAVVTSGDVRALCHNVTVVPAEIVQVDVVANVTLLPAASDTVIDTIASDLAVSFNAARGLGWDVTKSWLVAQMQVSGVHHVELVTPSANVSVAPYQCAALRNVTINYSGRGA